MSRLHNSWMIRLPTFIAAFTGLALVACTGVAQAQGDPWSATIAVADRSPEQQREAQKLALRAVLLANSGDKTLLNRDDVREALREAESWVERFDFRTPEPGTVIPRSTPLTERVRDTGQATQLMVVSFDREQLGPLIAGEVDAEDDEVAVDTPSDPLSQVESALMWLLIEDGRREILIGDDAALNVRARAREIAGARGITLRYPASEVTDSESLSADEIRAGNLDRVRAASARYGEPVVLVGRLSRDGLGAWRGQWQKLAVADAVDDAAGEAAGGIVVEENFTTDSLDKALQSGLGFLFGGSGGAADTYAYGGRASSDTEALVWIGALDGVSEYATAMEFLAGVAGVETVYPKEIDERGIVFTIVPRDALPAIASAASSQGWLRRTQPPTDVMQSVDERATSTGSVTDLRSGDERFQPRERPRVPLARNAELAYEYVR